MKLDLEPRRGFAILRVTEKVTLSDFHVLRAGINKICKTNTKKEPLVLDLMKAMPDKAADAQLPELQLIAFNMSADLLVVSDDPDIGQFKTLQEATQLLISGKSLMALREQILTKMLGSLEGKRGLLEARATALREKHVTQEHLPEENEHLRAILTAMEQQAWELMAELGENKLEEEDAKVRELKARLLKYVIDEKMQVSSHLGGNPPGEGAKK